MGKKDEIELAMQQVRLCKPFLKLFMSLKYLIKVTEKFYILIYNSVIFYKLICNCSPSSLDFYDTRALGS